MFEHGKGRSAETYKYREIETNEGTIMEKDRWRGITMVSENMKGKKTNWDEAAHRDGWEMRT